MMHEWIELVVHSTDATKGFIIQYRVVNNLNAKRTTTPNWQLHYVVLMTGRVAGPRVVYLSLIHI